MYGGDYGVIAIGGTLEYDKNMLTLKSRSAQGNWSISYNDANGKFVADRDGGWAKSGETVVRLTFQANSGKKGNTTVTVKNVSVADGFEEKNLANTSRTITINEKKKDEEQNNNQNNEQNNNQNNNGQGNNQGTTTRPGNNQTNNSSRTPVPTQNVEPTPEPTPEVTPEETPTPTQNLTPTPDYEYQYEQKEVKLNQRENNGPSIIVYILGGIAVLLIIAIIVVIYLVKVKNKDIKQLLRGK